MKVASSSARTRRNTLGAVVLLLGIVVTAGLYTYHKSTKVDDKNTNTTAKTQTTDTQETATPHIDAQLQNILDSWVRGHTFDAAVSVSELSGEMRTASISSTSLMTTASTYKIYIAYAVLHEVEKGTYTMATNTRTGQTISNALEQMIVDSSNTSAEALGFLVGWDKVNELAKAAGATRTDINNYDSSGNATNGDKQSTVQDLNLMLTKLEQGRLLDKNHTTLLLNLMKKQNYRERIPAGIPTGIAVADKPGWLTSIENDAAIIYAPKSTYVLVIMTDGSTTQPLADLSRQIYDYLQR